MFLLSPNDQANFYKLQKTHTREFNRSDANHANLHQSHALKNTNDQNLRLQIQS